MDVEQYGTDERFVAVLYGKGIVGKGVQAIRGGLLGIDITGQCAESGSGEGDVVFGGDLPAEIDICHGFGIGVGEEVGHIVADVWNLVFVESSGRDATDIAFHP